MLIYDCYINVWKDIQVGKCSLLQTGKVNTKRSILPKLI